MLFLSMIAGALLGWNAERILRSIVKRSVKSPPLKEEQKERREKAKDFKSL